jgi:hypothetical protein
MTAALFSTFNFLASLINGNLSLDYVLSQHVISCLSFNFLASLINGNRAFAVSVRPIINGTFNFLASLINGNSFGFGFGLGLPLASGLLLTS